MASGPPRHRVTRRRFLVGATTGVAALTVGSVVVATAHEEEIVVTLVRRALPGVTLDEPSLRRFGRDFFADRSDSSFRDTAKWRLLAAFDNVVGVDQLRRLGFDSELEYAVRGAVSFFLTNSNFFALDDPRSAPIVYRKRVACGTPYRPGRTPQASRRPGHGGASGSHAQTAPAGG
jgi:hypothetical protein